MYALPASFTIVRPRLDPLWVASSSPKKETPAPHKRAVGVNVPVRPTHMGAWARSARARLAARVHLRPWWGLKTPNGADLHPPCLPPKHLYRIIYHTSPPTKSLGHVHKAHFTHIVSETF